MLGPVNLGGAQHLLLPERVPMQFFGTAVVGHVFAWLGLAITADDLADFGGGPGPVLAAVHVLTLGVLVPTAMGASLQMLPVALGRPAPAARICDAVFWLTVPGALTLISGFATASRPAIIAGAVVTAGGIAAYAVTVGRVVNGAREPRPLVLHVWAALAALTAAAALALTLSFDYASPILADHARVATTHLVLAAFGFMGMLALGFSHVLIPMFAISEAPHGWAADLSFATALAAVVAAVLGLLIGLRWLIAAALVTGLAGCGLHVSLMTRSLARRVPPTSRARIHSYPGLVGTAVGNAHAGPCGGLRSVAGYRAGSFRVSAAVRLAIDATDGSAAADSAFPCLDAHRPG